jgi:hypothetical protein
MNDAVYAGHHGHRRLGLHAGRAAQLGAADAAAGVRAALERGAAAAVSMLGRTDGFLGNPKVRIPLPGALEDAAKLLSRLGQKKASTN